MFNSSFGIGSQACELSLIVRALVTPRGLMQLAFLGIVGSTVPGCASQVDTRASNSLCPNLEGVYSEEGLTYRGGQRAQDVSHLSWLVGGDKRSSLNPLNTMAGPGKPSIYFVQTWRVSNPSSNRFELEALNNEGKMLGLFSFGPEDGWRCADGAFEIRREGQGGGEGTWGDEVSIHRLPALLTVRWFGLSIRNTSNEPFSFSALLLVLPTLSMSNIVFHTLPSNGKSMSAPARSNSTSNDSFREA